MVVVTGRDKNLYTYRVTWSTEDEEWVGLCAEFPGLSWLADSPESALSGIRRVVADVVADMQSSGEPVPEPLATRRYSGTLTLRLTGDTHKRLAIEAAEQRVSINRLINSKLTRA